MSKWWGGLRDKDFLVFSPSAYNTVGLGTTQLYVGNNRAVAVPCYAPTHTFVEKLQTISTKYSRLDETQSFPANFLRHYYDVYCLLELEEVHAFMRSPAD